MSTHNDYEENVDFYLIFKILKPSPKDVKTE